jgi:signal transduction histidine kinase
MKLAGRITLTASVIVAVTLGVYAFVTARNQEAEVRDQVARDAVRLAASFRAALESEDLSKLDWEPRGAVLSQGLARSGLPWRVVLLDARSAPSEALPPGQDPTLERLWRLLVIRTAIVDDGARLRGRPAYVHLEPLRVPSAQSMDGYRIVGAIELTRQLDDETDNLLLQLYLPLLLIGGLLVFGVYQSASRPIRQLIAGIDDVARGDLSHVVLSERDDELGALASRFNDMTASLREAQEETRRAAESRSQLEQHLRSSEKMATVGSIAAEIAHEVGTPLNVVTGRARALARKADDPEAVQKNATIIAEQAARITRIIQRLLDFARRRVGEADAGPTAIDLVDLAAGTVEFLDHQLDANRVSAGVEASADIVPVLGVRDQLQQVLLNLCVNAVQAMPKGGQLHLKLGKLRRRRPGLEVAPEQVYVVLDVADTGVGIPVEDRDKIFEPFYTSKSESGGSGLGLAVSHTIVKEHDGWMEVLSNPAGRGTLFRVFLPAADGDLPVRRRASTSRPYLPPE